MATSAPAPREARKVLPRAHSGGAFRYLALGDSYTIGESVSSIERWPAQLAAKVGACDLEYVAQTGWTTAELLEAVRERNLIGPYDLVSLQIGVNNQYRGQSVVLFTSELAVLAALALRLADGDPDRVLALSIPDWSVTPFAAGRERARIAHEIDSFNKAARKVYEFAGIAIVDVTEISGLAANNPDLLAKDGLHPSGAMYGLWAEKALQELSI